MKKYQEELLKQSLEKKLEGTNEELVMETHKTFLKKKKGKN